MTRGWLALTAAVVCAAQLRADEPPAMPGMQEKMSYAFGYDLGKTLAHQGVPVETNLVLQGFHDGLLRTRPALSDSDLAAAMAACEAALKARQIEWRRNASEARRNAGIRNASRDRPLPGGEAAAAPLTNQPAGALAPLPDASANAAVKPPAGRP